MLEEVPLSRDHARRKFDCGSRELNHFIRRFACPNQELGVSRTYVLVDSDEPRRIRGYYTVSTGQLEASQLTPEHQARLPRYPVPVIRMGRLAVDSAFQRHGYGKYLIGSAVTRAREVRKAVGVVAIVVDAKDDAAAAFYQKYGFTRCDDNPLTLYLMLGND
ncbi:GNAT family N-acetyltransferase [Gammaproteobacteria bacterium AB-CW1]|uniref:GNAT family N-acetyltransferase n=1 Tax=Natronospira elongata TaxID=3110268 RepID=A0AAP6MKT6_9GAMM|nr:GNAT family N-acetyltransferase [Gammaproteobacteria bacterium AB-CW1]